MDLSRTVEGGICANCGKVRPLAVLLAFWPVGFPDQRSFVCRPLEAVPPFMNCFREAVGTVDEHVIAPATDTTLRETVPA